MPQATVEIGEFLPDRQRYGLSVYVNNCVPHGGIYRQLESMLAVTNNGLTGRCLGGISVKSKNGTGYTYAGDANRLYRISNLVVTEINSGFTASPNWEFADFGDNVIAVNGWTDAPQAIVNGAAAFTPLAGSPPKARHVATVRDFVVLGNINDGVEKPNFVRWSGLGNHTQWTIGVNQADDQEIPSGGHVVRVLGGEYGTVLMERAVVRMSYVGTPTIFTFDEIDSVNGCVAPNSAVKVGSTIYYLGHDGFYANGGGVSQSISAERVSRWFYSNVDSNFLGDVIACYDFTRRVIFWLFRSLAASNGLPDRALIYSPESNRFAPADLEAEWVMDGYASGIDMDSGQQVQGTLVMDDVNLSMDSASLQGGSGRFFSLFNSQHQQAQLIGAPLTAELETPEKDFFDMGRAFINGVRPRVEGAGSVEVSLGTRNGGEASVWTTYVTQNARTGFANFRSRARYASARLRIEGGFTAAYAADFMIYPGGKL